MIEALKSVSSDLDVPRGARLSNTRCHSATARPRRSPLARWTGMFLFIACNLEFVMMDLMQRSIHQDHEGFSELFRDRQRQFLHPRIALCPCA